MDKEDIRERLQLAIERVDAALNEADCEYGHLITSDNVKIMDVQILLDFVKSRSTPQGHC